MKVRLKLKPGQRGTKHLTQQYGDRLVCVRYRYEEKSRKRDHTDADTPIPVPSINNSGRENSRFYRAALRTKNRQPEFSKPDKIVHLRAAFDEIDIRRIVKEAVNKFKQ